MDALLIACCYCYEPMRLGAAAAVREHANGVYSFICRPCTL